MSNEFLRNTFGKNIKLPSYTLNQSKQTLNKAVKELWSPIFKFVDNTNTYINGDIQKEINYMKHIENKFLSLNPQQVGTKFNKMC